MEPSFNFMTPVISALPCRKPLEDSGYLSTTPDSGSLPLSRRGWPLSGDLYTPEVANPAAVSFKSKRMTLRRHKSLPVSGEESQMIHYVQQEAFTHLDYTSCEESMSVDEDMDNVLMNGEHEADHVHEEPGNQSFYEGMVLSSNDYEASFMDETKFVQESNILENFNVDFETVKLETVLPSAISASESLPTAAKKRRVLKQGPVTYTSWRQELCRRDDTRPLSSFSGRNTVDFLYRLGVASDHSGCVSLILSYLSPHELSSAARVSSSWRAVVTADERSRRRLAEPTVPSPEKENTKKASAASAVARAGAMRSIENLRPEQPLTPPKAAPDTCQMEVFHGLSREMKEGYRHDRCVKCNGRAVVQMESEIGCCPSPCKYVYCARCKRQDHRPAPCVCVGAWDPLQERKARVSTKKTKRRLLRLLC